MYYSNCIIILCAKLLKVSFIYIYIYMMNFKLKHHVADPQTKVNISKYIVHNKYKYNVNIKKLSIFLIKFFFKKNNVYCEMRYTNKMIFFKKHLDI